VPKLLKKPNRIF